MADFEDSLSPTWINLLAGQKALAEAVRGELTFEEKSGLFFSFTDLNFTSSFTWLPFCRQKVLPEQRSFVHSDGPSSWLASHGTSFAR
jgi:hypothetical protein